MPLVTIGVATMTSDDIYGNKERYDMFKKEINFLVIPPEQRKTWRRKRAIYYCKNKANLQYFKKLCSHFEARDISYIRRIRILSTLKQVCHFTTKDLKHLDRNDIDEITSKLHQAYKTLMSKTDFIKALKRVWKELFPEKDEKGRIDETLIPYAVRHLSAKIDKSRETRKQDKLTLEEGCGVIISFCFSI